VKNKWVFLFPDHQRQKTLSAAYPLQILNNIECVPDMNRELHNLAGYQEMVIVGAGFVYQAK